MGAATIDRSTWPALVGDEATYLMAAESLAFDGDYRYTAADFERFRHRWKVEPEGLILQRGHNGALFYGKPVLWPAYAAPFVTLFGRQGPFIANALALGVAALCAALTLATRTGPWAPTWIAAHVFGTVVFAWVFWAHSDLLSMALVALALAAILTAELSERERNRFSRPSPLAWVPWCLAGSLLAAVIWSRPPYAVLLLPVIVALPPRRRRRAAGAFVLGAVLVSGGLLWSQSSRTGSYSAYGGERRSFYAHTGWPDVGPDGAAARARFDDTRDDAAWEGPAGALEVARWGADRLSWNLLYTFVGRHVGLLPYFSAVLLLLVARPRGALAWSLLGAFGLAILFFALNRPLNFWGGGGSLANRYLMPLLPALWFVPTRVTRPWAAAAVALVAAPFVWPLWVAPRAAPYGPEGSYRWVTPAAKALLPYETTQSHLKPAGIEDVVHHNLWVKFLDRGVLPLDGSLTCPALVRGHLLLGSAQPVSVLRLRLAGADPSASIDLGGAKQLRSEHEGTSLIVDLQPHLRAHHRMWWGDDQIFLYELSVRCRPQTPAPATFELQALEYGR